MDLYTYAPTHVMGYLTVEHSSEEWDNSLLALLQVYHEYKFCFQTPIMIRNIFVVIRNIILMVLKCYTAMFLDNK